MRAVVRPETTVVLILRTSEAEMLKDLVQNGPPTWDYQLDKPIITEPEDVYNFRVELFETLKKSLEEK
jgi:hypothetical protein